MYSIKLTMPEWQVVKKAVERALKNDLDGHYKDYPLDVWKEYETVWEVQYPELQGLADAVMSLRDEEGPDEPMCDHILYDIIEKEASRHGKTLL